ncbi:MAG TPA: ABC transporter permease [Blastocatellia bacterium]|nr:ABC transporter permease [Blastocatellia bacterium]
MRFQRWIYTIRLRLRSLFLRKQVETELDEEFCYHVEQQVQDFLAKGLSDTEARYMALRSMGGLDQQKERCRTMRRTNFVDDLVKDLNYGVRMMLRQPAFTTIVVLTLALGIGASTAMFSVVNAVLLKPLPYPESDKLVFVSERTQQSERTSIAWPNYADWRTQNHVFEKIGVYNFNSYNLTGDDAPERLQAGQATADFFAALRVNPSLGRFFTDDEDKPGAAPVVVLGYGLWQRRFGGDAKILNQSIKLNDRSYTVVGVLPPDFQYFSKIDLWVSAGQLSADWQHRATHPNLSGIARLRPGVTLEQARADMEAIAAGLQEKFPDTNRGHSVTIKPFIELIVGDSGPSLWLLLAASGFLLLIACANVANLLLVRATVRQREMGIRAALGAGRGRLTRQLLTESVVLALLGGGFGLLFSQWGLSLLIPIAATTLPRVTETRLDGRVLAYSLAVACLTGILFGLAPAWRSGRTSLQQLLQQAGKDMNSGKQRAHDLLAVTEIALTIILLVGTGLLVHSFYRLTQVDSGFNYTNLLSFSLTLPEKKYTKPEQRADFFNNLSERLKTLPGVQSVAIASGLPFGASSWRIPFVVDGAAIPKDMPSLEACLVSPDYFTALGIPLKSGRFFSDQENNQNQFGDPKPDNIRQPANLRSIIIDEEFARRYWPSENPVGKTIRLAPIDSGSPSLTIVGVVGRVKMDKLSAESNRVQAYFPYSQFAFPNMTFVIKSALDQSQVLASVRERLKSLDSQQPIYNIRTLEQIRSNSIAPERLNLTLVVSFGSVALLLAAIGLYGVISYATAQRTHEFGIRRALGATSGDVMKLVIGHGMKLAFAGLLVGLGGAFALTRFITGLLFGVSASDPYSFIGIATLVTLVLLLACCVPARRATKADPMTALRYE